MNKKYLEELKRQEESKMKHFADQMKSFREEFPTESISCDWYQYRVQMELFHRGRTNLLIDLLREI